jgi:hypothetical protein
MPEFTTLELAVLSVIADGHPTISDHIRGLMSSARLSVRDNTGHGFFTSFAVDRTISPLAWTERKLDGPDAEVQVGKQTLLMGFILWLDDGYPSCLEGFQYGMPAGGDLDLKGVDLGDLRWLRATP